MKSVRKTVDTLENHYSTERIKMFRKISAGFTAGAIGALIDSINIWFLGVMGITAMLGIGLKPEFTSTWLYPRIVWGGIWGLLFITPIMRKHLVLRGMLFSIVPSSLMLFVVFPQMGKGIMGLSFGKLTPALVVLLNFIWGIVGSFWYKSSTK